MFVSQLIINKVGFLKHEKYPVPVLKRARLALLLYILINKPGIRERASNEDTDTEFNFV